MLLTRLRHRVTTYEVVFRRAIILPGRGRPEPTIGKKCVPQALSRQQ